MQKVHDVIIKFFIQLLYQTYKPDKRSGYLPLPIQSDPTYTPVDLGIKIATGFQILLKSTKQKFDGTPSDSTQFGAFLAKLKSNGYFGDELEHSKNWEILYKKALAFFEQYEDGNDEADNFSFRIIAGHKVEKLSKKFDLEKPDIENKRSVIKIL
jgi:hypothetical protein